MLVQQCCHEDKMLYLRPHSIVCDAASLVATERAEKRRRKKGLVRSANALVRRGMIHLRGVFSHVPEGQNQAPLAQWFRARTRTERLEHRKDHARSLGAQATDRPVGRLVGGRGPDWRRSALLRSVLVARVS